MVMGKRMTMVCDGDGNDKEDDDGDDDDVPHIKTVFLLYNKAII